MQVLMFHKKLISVNKIPDSVKEAPIKIFPSGRVPLV